MEQLIKLLKENNLLLQRIQKNTLLIDEQGKEHGALFFLDVNGRSYKIMIPAPHHRDLLVDGGPMAQTLLNHKQAMLLK